MIKVNFVEPVANRQWVKWKADAARRTKALIILASNQQSFTISDALYKRMRQEIFDAFAGKCAYCEAKFKLDQSGDVEHFRPKGGVTDDRDRPIKLRLPSPRKDHPGYYWLAYDWHNLLPSCAACNRPNKTRQGLRVGKWNRFPVVGFRAIAPGEEPNEKALFLHPVIDDPQEHMVFDTTTGIVGGTTRRGRATIKLLGLNREGLPEARRDVYNTMVAVIWAAVNAAEDGNNTARLSAWMRIMTEHLEGSQAYALAGRQALKDNRELLLRLRATLPL
jgi:uncharacterized protein (TIGR02646 family)